jgi:uncharacterized membrane protein
MNRVKLKITAQMQLWCCVVTILLVLGTLFRAIYLDRPVYWVDEVATSMRVSGYTLDEVTHQLATGLPLNVTDLLEFQDIRSDRPWTNFLYALTQSPEHAPLYFVLVRLWVEVFGCSVTAMRSLSVVFSLLSLPAIYGFCRDLFQANQFDPLLERTLKGFQGGNAFSLSRIKYQPLRLIRGWFKRRKVRALTRIFLSMEGRRFETRGILVGWSAMGLLSISPFFIAYAQEARPYSLWVLLLLLLNWFLWRSLQFNRRWLWFSYTLCAIASLYTSFLTLLVILGQGVSVIFFYPKRRRTYSIATGIALLAFLPWCCVAIAYWQTLQDNTTWMRVAMPLWALLAVWFYSLAVLFFDVPVAAGMPVVMGFQVILAIAAVGLIGYATYCLVRQTPRSVGLFLLMGAISTPLILLSIDLIGNGQAAATSRYLMPTQLGALIAVAYLLSTRIFSAWRRWRIIAVTLLSVSLISCAIGIKHTSDYQKSRNLSNPAIIDILKQADSPTLIAAADQIQDLISLSYQLDSEVRIYILPNLELTEDWLKNTIHIDRPTFWFNPSQSIRAAIENSEVGVMRQVYQPIKLISGELGLTLWRIERHSDLHEG